MNKNKTLDSFTHHFAAHFPDRQTKLTIGEARGYVNTIVELQGSPVYYNKSFGELNCSLCMHEQLIIFRHSRRNPTQIINTSTKFYGACRHKPRFHRYPNNYTLLSTDDKRNSSERVEATGVNNTPNSNENTPALCIYIDTSQIPTEDYSTDSETVINGTDNSSESVKNYNCSYMDV